MAFYIVSPANVDRQSASDSWELEPGANETFDTVEAAREAIDILQTQLAFGTLAIREDGFRGPLLGEIYKRTCIYCDAEVNDHTYVPEDADQWQGAADEHEADCEWIATRAHTLPVA